MHRSIICLLLAVLSPVVVRADDPGRKTVRIATYNIQELTARKLAQVDDQGRGNHPQLMKAAEILQRVRPDIVLINEIDYDGPDDRTIASDKPNCAQLFLDRYLKVSQGGLNALEYPHLFYQPVNTGVPTGLDLDNDGRSDGPADAYGFGRYPGQYGMVLYSRFPLHATAARTFRLLRWIDMPAALIPDGTAGKPGYLSAEETARFRLSSKSHWDVPVRIGDRDIHFLCSHPTPPVFDGDEDINGRRNFDEIRLWADYIAGGDRAKYLRDDQGKAGGLDSHSQFIIVGDLNSDAVRSDTTYGMAPIQQLFDLPLVVDPRPSSLSTKSIVPAMRSDGNLDQYKTSHFGRLDYVLTSRGIPVQASGIFRPSANHELHRLIDRPDPASDHYLVWIDVVDPRK